MDETSGEAADFEIYIGVGKKETRRGELGRKGGEVWKETRGKAANLEMYIRVGKKETRRGGLERKGGKNGRKGDEAWTKREEKQRTSKRTTV